MQCHGRCHRRGSGVGAPRAGAFAWALALVSVWLMVAGPARAEGPLPECLPPDALVDLPGDRWHGLEFEVQFRACVSGPGCADPDEPQRGEVWLWVHPRGAVVFGEEPVGPPSRAMLDADAGGPPVVIMPRLLPAPARLRYGVLGGGGPRRLAPGYALVWEAADGVTRFSLALRAVPSADAVRQIALGFRYQGCDPDARCAPGDPLCAGFRQGARVVRFDWPGAGDLLCGAVPYLGPAPWEPVCGQASVPVDRHLLVRSPADADPDEDGVVTCEGIGCDNCFGTGNPDQADLDADAIGDVCDCDADGDDVYDFPSPVPSPDAPCALPPASVDNCPGVYNPPPGELGRQLDADGDGLGDACDVCPEVPDPAQVDGDGDGLGAACDPDDDGDLVLDRFDNCPDWPNLDQLDRDGDGLGDGCDPDADADGVLGPLDVCPYLPKGRHAVDPCRPIGRPPVSDADGDGLRDAIDPCPTVAEGDHGDRDGDGWGAVCDVDDDGDGLIDLCDPDCWGKRDDCAIGGARRTVAGWLGGRPGPLRGWDDPIVCGAARFAAPFRRMLERKRLRPVDRDAGWRLSEGLP